MLWILCANDNNYILLRAPKINQATHTHIHTHVKKVEKIKWFNGKSEIAKKRRDEAWRRMKRKPIQKIKNIN